MTPRLLLPLTLALALLVSAAPTSARRGDDGVRRAGTCTGASSAKLKAMHDDGRIEVEFEVDQNRAGVRWRARLRQNGDLIANQVRVTRAPSGSFEIERRPRNRRGTDRITASAVRDGETCRTSLRI